MNIQFARSYIVNGKCYPDLEQAQLAALDTLFSEHATDPASLTILQHRDEILDILTTTASSKPAARKINGGSKPRKRKETPAVPAEVNAALQDQDA